MSEFLQSKTISSALFQLLMNNQMQFIFLWSCVPPDFVVQINNFFSLVLFSPVIHKRRGEKQMNKTYKYKLGSSLKIRFTFFYPKDVQNFFLEIYRLCRNSGNEANSRRLGSWEMSAKIDMWFTTWDKILVKRLIVVRSKVHWFFRHCNQEY